MPALASRQDLSATELRRLARLARLEPGPVRRPYGAARGPKYRGQREPTASRITRDPEFGGSGGQSGSRAVGQ